MRNVPMTIPQAEPTAVQALLGELSAVEAQMRGATAARMRELGAQQAALTALIVKALA